MNETNDESVVVIMEDETSPSRLKKILSKKKVIGLAVVVGTAMLAAVALAVHNNDDTES